VLLNTKVAVSQYTTVSVRVSILGRR